MHKDAQHIYDNAMPPEPPVIEEWRVKDRMLSDYEKIPVSQFYAPLECADDEDAAKTKNLIATVISHHNSWGSVDNRNNHMAALGEIVTSIIEKSLSRQAEYDISYGDIDRSL